MRYIGSKDNLLPFIEAAVRAGGISDGVFCDLFAGTTVVGRHFKRLGFSVVSNDLMRYAYVFGKAYLENNAPPAFDGLELSAPPGLFPQPLGRLEAALAVLNTLPPVPGFMYDHYCDEGEDPRMYFSADNAGRIDATRGRMQTWLENGEVTDAEFHILLASLLEAVPGVSNTSGTYGSFLKFWEARSRKRLTLTLPPLIESDRTHQVFQTDGAELLGEISADVLYLDPPYNARQYAPNYHILETVARWDSPRVYGKSGLRPYTAEKSRYCRQDTALDALRAAACTADCRLFLLSYNSEGIMPDEAIRDVLSARGPVKVHEQVYRRYKSDSDGENRKYKPNKTIVERIYAVRTGA
jgi:adenine-specific DNA-methyltransferase